MYIPIHAIQEQEHLFHLSEKRMTGHLKNILMN
jgi:hypothetical protein